MLSLQLDRLFGIPVPHGLTEDDLAGYQNRIASDLQKIEARNQGFYKIIDSLPLTEMKTYADTVRPQIDSVVVLGIGGSALGTICLNQALGNLFTGKVAPDSPTLYVLDNIDPVLLHEVEDVINLATTLFVVITKSGGTPETLAQYAYFRERCESQGLAAKERFAFITDPDNGLLRQIGQRDQITMFDVPPNVGGRFSVLTAVGILPAYLIGIDVDALLSGARTMRDRFLSTEWKVNLPFQLAAVQHILGTKGKTIHILMPYAQKLIRFADWYRQLLAESIGKQVNIRGEEVFVGLTPVNALGATDQHSQSQLYNEGPNDKLIMFVEVANPMPKLPIPATDDILSSVSYLEGVDFGQLLNTEKQGTEQALTQYNRPNLTIKIDTVNAQTLGELFLLFEGATAFLGEFYEIDAFNQPGVELSKQLTKQLLS